MIRHRILALGAVVVTALAACKDQPAPPFEAEGTGSISGLLFFDADNNGQFTPIGGDTLLTNVPVRLLARAGNELLAQTTSSASGTFAFAGVPLGTHSLQVMGSEALTGALVFCNNPLPASVYRDENRFLAVPGKLGCVIPIAEAEALEQGAAITVAGVVTVGQGRFRGDNVVIQDFTGGFTVFGVGASFALAEGDSIEVTGTLGQFGGEPQLVSPRITTVKRGVGEVEPRERTAAQMSAATPTSADVGRLLVIRDAQVTSLAGPTDRDGTITDATGSVALRLDGNALTAIGTAAFAADKCYDITGVLSTFNGTPQLKPRIPADVAEVPCP
jgi:hypothetical protein